MNDEVNNRIECFGRFEVNLENKTITRTTDQARIKVSRSEAYIFTYLAHATGKAVYREVLLKTCWDGKVVTNNSLTVAIKNLRTALQKIDESNIIITEPKFGYSINHIEINTISKPEHNNTINRIRKKIEKEPKKKALINYSVVGISFIITLLFLYQQLYFMSAINEKETNVLFDNHLLPNPINMIIKENTNSQISRWYALSIGGLCDNYKLIAVRNNHYTDYSNLINQEHCHD